MQKPTAGNPRAADGVGVEALLACPAELLDTTFDQLRTLVVAREMRTALAAARLLGREQSSVQKQLDTLNRNFQRMCGELLVVKQGRGQPLLFTPSGARFADHASQLLQGWQVEVNDTRRRVGQTLAVGTTEFTLGFLGRVWQRVADDFHAQEIEMNVIHVRTKDSFAKLDSKEVDLMCGGFAVVAGSDEVPLGYEFLEWHREGLVLLTNLPPRELPLREVAMRRLPAIPLVIPRRGVIVDFLERWYGPDIHNRLTVAATIDDIYYGFALLRSGMTYGCMIVSKTIGEDAMAGRLPTGPDFRLVSLAADFDPTLELVTGVFARRGERSRFDGGHPLNVLWDAFVTEAHPNDPGGGS